MSGQQLLRDWTPYGLIECIILSGTSSSCSAGTFVWSAIGAVPGGKSANVVEGLVNPRLLLSRQARTEMSGSTVKRIQKDMQQRGFDPNNPIDVAQVDGRYIILDGHHRAAAAMRVGIGQVPVRIYPVTREEADLLLKEVAEALQ